MILRPLESGLVRAIRVIPPGTPGKTRLASLLLRQILLRAEEAEINTPWGRLQVPSLREPIARALLCDGVYERPVLSFLRRCVPSGGVFIDVGANIGCFTIPMSRHVGSTGVVLAIEASPAVYPYLARNVERNGCHNARIVAAAAAERDMRSVPFYVAPAAKFGMGTRSPIFQQPGSATLVSARTLDSLVLEHEIAAADAIKVDVEGHEAAVFRGARTLLERSPSVIVIFEFADWAEGHATGRPGEAQEMLMDLGFSLWRLGDRSRTISSVPRPLTRGFAMLIACRERPAASNFRGAAPLL